jgi:glycosyltransferase involved in cell wall biosynthesis
MTRQEFTSARLRQRRTPQYRAGRVRPIDPDTLDVLSLGASGVEIELRAAGWFLTAGADNPLISIVMLCYNHEKFVAEALDGVLAQTYAPLEIVIVDDFSTDRTLEIVSAKLAGYPNPSDIRIIRNPRNLRLLGTCDVGIEATRGEFVVLTCDDDVMLPDMVSEMADVWRSQDVSLVVTNAEFIDGRSNLLGRTHRDCAVLADDSFETLVRDGANACCFGASMGFDRQLYSTFGMPPAHLDNLDIMFPFYAYVLKGARFLNKPLLRYRVHGANNSLSLIDERSDDLEKLIVRDQIFYGHIAHAVAMQEALDRLSETMPARYAELAPRIDPLLAIQVVEMAKKMVRNRVEFSGLGGRVEWFG